MKIGKLSGTLLVLLLVGTMSGSISTRPTLAATEPTGKVAGVVLDANDARVVNATITVHKHDTTRTLKSGDEGEFEVLVPAGDYRITVEASGFRKFSYAPLTVIVDQTKRIDVHLKVAVPSGLTPAIVLSETSVAGS